MLTVCALLASLAAPASAQEAPADVVFPSNDVVFPSNDVVLPSNDVVVVINDPVDVPTDVPVGQADDIVPAAVGPDPCRADCVVANRSVRQWYLDVLWGSVEPVAAVSGSGGPIVAVLDGGVDLAQVELVGRVRRPACAPVEASDLVHGTAIAGLLASGFNDAVGLSPVVDGVQVLDVPVFRVADFESSTDSATVAAAVRCAVAEGADVINLSLSGSCNDDAALRAAIAEAQAAGVSVVAAAGNDPASGATCPASYPGVVGVAATDATNRVKTTVAAADIAAPGLDILTAGVHSRSPFVVMSGSSFATPMVSASLALLAAAHPEWTPAQRTAHMLAQSRTTADRLLPLLSLDRLLDPAPSFLAVGTDGRLVGVGGPTAALGVLAASSEPARVGNMWAATCQGTWSVNSAGALTLSGAARNFGDLTPYRIAAPVVGVQPTKTGDGYWMVGADGGVFAFGAAPFLGSMGGIRLSAPVVGITPTESGRGYWLVGADGAVYAFGDARFLGSIVTKGVRSLERWQGGYALILAKGAVTFPQLGFIASPGGVDVVDVVVTNTPTAHEMWFLGADHAVRSTADRATVLGPPSTALLRATHTDDC